MKTSCVGRWAALVGVGLLLAGCIPVAVNPFFTESDLIQEPRLVGTWQDADGENTWVFASTPEKYYRLTVTGEEARGTYAAHLFRLGDHVFLDLTPDQPDIEAAVKTNAAMTLMLPTHMVGRVRWQNERLSLDWLSMNWLSERLKENPDLVAHQTPDDSPLVLTGSTADLQAFIRQHAETDEAWEATLLTRVPSDTSD